jgi:TolB-like protein
MKMRNVKILICLLISLLVAFMQAPFSSAKEAKRVAILPFTMNADRDLTFLQEGIMDMLSSRLAWKGEVEVLEKGPVKKEVARVGGPLDKGKALGIGKALEADYVIIGSRTVFGESVSIDARILDVAKSEELITASKESKGMDEVIPTVNQFASDINEKIMGRYIRPSVPVAAAVAPAGPGGLVAVGEDFEGKGVGHTQSFKVEIISLDVGDVDGDGENELVFVNRDTVFVYKWTETAFAQFKAVKGGWSAQYVYVNVADLDKNGRAEVYVSGVGDVGVSSLVLEWDGNGFKKIWDRQPWFFRVIDFPGRGQTLIGQQRTAGRGFRGGVHFLTREGDGFVSTGRVKLPRYGNVFNFVFADFEGTGNLRTVVLGLHEYLHLYGPGEDEIWRSEEYYGGSLTFMETTEKIYVYISSPIYMTDVDGDGRPEVMICKNRSRTGRLFSRFRYFSSGTLNFLSGDQAGLATKWQSRKQSGPIVGYRVSDLDHDGLQELLIASVSKQKHALGEGRSRIVVYDLK